MDIRYRAVMQRIIDGTPTATQSAELTGGAPLLCGSQWSVEASPPLCLSIFSLRRETGVVEFPGFDAKGDTEGRTEGRTGRQTAFAPLRRRWNHYRQLLSW